MALSIASLVKKNFTWHTTLTAGISASSVQALNKAQVQALSTSQLAADLPYLTDTQVGWLTASQVSNLSAGQLLTTNGSGHTILSGIAGAQFFGLTAFQIQNLSVDTLRPRWSRFNNMQVSYLTDAQAKQLSAADLLSITAAGTRILNCINSAQIALFTQTTLSGVLSYMTTGQVWQLSNAQVGALTATQLIDQGVGKKLSQMQINVLSESQLTSNSPSAGASVVGSLDDWQIGALTANQLTSNVINGLSNKGRIKALQAGQLTDAVLGRMSVTAIYQLTPAQLTSDVRTRLLKNSAALPVVVKYLDQSTVQALGTSQLSTYLPYFTDAQVGYLTSTQASNLTVAQLQTRLPSGWLVLQGLTTAQIKVISATTVAQVVTQMTNVQMLGLTSLQVQGLGAGALDAVLPKLGNAQIGYLLNTQMQALSANNLRQSTASGTLVMNCLNASQIQSLSQAILASIVANMTTGQVWQLSNAQVGALTATQLIDQGVGKKLSQMQINVLSESQLTSNSPSAGASVVGSLDDWQIGALTANQLTSNVINGLSNKGRIKALQAGQLTSVILGRLTKASVQQLSATQLRALAPALLAVECAGDQGGLVRSLALVQINALNPSQLSKEVVGRMYSWQIQGLTNTQLTADVLANLIGSFMVPTLTSQQIGGLSAKMLLVGAGTLLVNALSQEQVSWLSQNQLSKEVVAKMDAQHVQGLTSAQLTPQVVGYLQAAQLLQANTAIDLYNRGQLTIEQMWTALPEASKGQFLLTRTNAQLCAFDGFAKTITTQNLLPQLSIEQMFSGDELSSGKLSATGLIAQLKAQGWQPPVINMALGDDWNTLVDFLYAKNDQRVAALLVQSWGDGQTAGMWKYLGSRWYPSAYSSNPRQKVLASIGGFSSLSVDQAINSGLLATIFKRDFPDYPNSLVAGSEKIAQWAMSTLNRAVIDNFCASPGAFQDGMRLALVKAHYFDGMADSALSACVPTLNRHGDYWQYLSDAQIFFLWPTVQYDSLPVARLKGLLTGLSDQLVDQLTADQAYQFAQFAAKQGVIGSVSAHLVAKLLPYFRDATLTQLSAQQLSNRDVLSTLYGLGRLASLSAASVMSSDVALSYFQSLGLVVAGKPLTQDVLSTANDRAPIVALLNQHNIRGVINDLDYVTLSMIAPQLFTADSLNVLSRARFADLPTSVWVALRNNAASLNATTICNILEAPSSSFVATEWGGNLSVGGELIWGSGATAGAISTDDFLRLPFADLAPLLANASVKADSNALSFAQVKRTFAALLSKCGDVLSGADLATLQGFAAFVKKVAGADSLVSQMVGNVVSGTLSCSNLITSSNMDAANNNKGFAAGGGDNGSGFIHGGTVVDTKTKAGIQALMQAWFEGAQTPSFYESDTTEDSTSTLYRYGAQFIHAAAQDGASLFGANNTPVYEDASQGRVGDCYFIATLAAAAAQDPELIKKTIVDLGNGVYAVRFLDKKGPGGVTWVTVNDIVPDLAAQAGPTGAIWAQLIEKAWAVYRPNAADHTIYALIGGGEDTEAVKALWGGLEVRIFNDYTMESDSSKLARVNADIENALATTPSSNEIQFVTYSVSHASSGSEVSLSGYKGILDHHVMAITDVTDLSAHEVNLYEQFSTDIRSECQGGNYSYSIDDLIYGAQGGFSVFTLSNNLIQSLSTFGGVPSAGLTSSVATVSTNHFETV